MPIHGSLFTQYQEQSSPDQFSLQNKKLLKVQMGYGPVWARAGSMVAYQGDIRFENTGSGGLGKLVKAAATGEGVKMMRCTGSGELFVAHEAHDVQVIYLENDMVSVNGANVLAFSDSISWDIKRIQARGAAMTGGLYNVELRGSGYVAVTTPLVVTVRPAQGLASVVPCSSAIVTSASLTGSGTGTGSVGAVPPPPEFCGVICDCCTKSAELTSVSAKSVRT